ncbi:MAG TPA: glycoside hydrolase family 2 TIM barrel-domain containing protein [Bacteroidales bacterium]|nr:glycoside hydrolase family 2 TIM barrel-domain containing protein [Bacteroidales bacterium]
MKKKPLIIIFLFAALLPLKAQKTERLWLSGKDKDHTVQWDFFCTHGRNSGKWGKIEVPSNWELQGYGSYHYGTTDMAANEKGLYKYEFSVPASWKGKRIFIVFEGSMTDTRVKLNGIPAGPVHQGAFYRFKYDITRLLRYNRKNLLEVTVSKESSDESINNAERMADYWVFGGIYRPVYLEAVPDRYIERVAIDAKADGSFLMEVLTGGGSQGMSITARVKTLSGIPFGSPMTMKVADNDSSVLHGQFENPALWNPESPYLYKVTVSLGYGNRIVHQADTKFGFRTIEERASDGFYINGHKIMFRGVCRHTFWPSSGRTSSRRLAIEDVGLMKDMNMNAVRMSHYPPDQFFLDVCDSMGMFVLDELAGWQSSYDTPVAGRLVKEMVTRDVNHPSVVIWDNGNEGGFNREVRNDYSLYDPQGRTVIEPWSKINGTDTKHYPGYKYVENALTKGTDIYFPTEFLHGLYDGGLGAGLDDYWNLMLSKKLSAGGFLWVFADEGVIRRDLNDSIDTHGNRAPDGILGPYHQKEGSYYTIKEIWSPVYFSEDSLPADFKGQLHISNRYMITNLNRCSFSYELVAFKKPFPDLSVKKVTGSIKAPDLEPGKSGVIDIDLPPDWKDYDIMNVIATDQYGRNINTWSWPVITTSEFVERTVTNTNDSVIAADSDRMIIVTTDETRVAFDKDSGCLSEVLYNGEKISFGMGPEFTEPGSVVKGFRHFRDGNNYIVDFTYNKDCHARWIMYPGGWLELDYDYRPKGPLDYSGISFSYPEKRVKSIMLLADGPYHVWKNRLKGTGFGLWEKKYNNTITGQTWNYPEFKGYYSGFYGVQVRTTELPFTVISATPGLYLRLYTPGKAKYSTGNGLGGTVNPPFPPGNISFLNAISAIGTKFSGPEEEGPQGQKTIFSGDVLHGKLFFRFGH